MTNKYFRDNHLLAVQAAARAAGVKGSAMVILAYLCEASEYKKPTVRVGKKNIGAKAGYERKCIQRALAKLRAVGVIEPIAYEDGGRGMATVYKLTTKVQNGVQNAPANAEAGENTQKGVQFVPKRGCNLSVKGVQNTPPTQNHSQNLSQKDERRIAGRNAAPPNNGGLVPDGSVTEQRKLVAAAMAAEGCDYGTARHLVAQGWRPAVA